MQITCFHFVFIQLGSLDDEKSGFRWFLYYYFGAHSNSKCHINKEYEYLLHVTIQPEKIK